MDDLGPATTCWRLHDGEFDEAQGVVRVAGRTTELNRSSQAILSLLLSNAGTPVRKEALLSAGWPGAIVHENSLAKAIGRLRDALGEAGSCLKAVYGIGYKLDAAILAPAEVVEAAPGAEPAPERPAAAWRRWIAPVAVLALLALAALGLANWRAQSPANPAEQFRTTPPVIADVPGATGWILWVDDHPENNIYEKRLFEHNHIAVHPATSSADALRLLAMYDYDMVISDMGRGEDRLAGPKLIQQMRARGDRTPAVIYTVRADDAAGQQAQRELVSEAGAQGLAVTPQEVRAIVLRFFERRSEPAIE